LAAFKPCTGVAGLAGALTLNTTAGGFTLAATDTAAYAGFGFVGTSVIADLVQFHDSVSL
jgi:hypothetical protein